MSEEVIDFFGNVFNVLLFVMALGFIFALFNAAENRSEVYGQMAEGRIIYEACRGGEYVGNP